MGYSLALVLVFHLVLIPTVSAFDLQQVFIQIDYQGNAMITITYQDNPVEYLGIKSFVATSSSLENYQRTRMQGNGKPADVKSLCEKKIMSRVLRSRLQPYDRDDTASLPHEDRQRQDRFRG